MSGLRDGGRANAVRHRFVVAIVVSVAVALAAAVTSAPATATTVADPSQSYAEGPGLETPQAGVEQQFTIHALDAAGSPVTSGGDVFSVSVTGPQSVTPSVQDNGDGTYLVRYTASVAGSYTVDVELDGESIRFVPKVVTVAPAFGLQTVTYGGSGCPSGSAGLSVAADRTAATLIFDQLLATSGPLVPTSESDKRCEIALVISSTVSSTVLVIADIRGYVSLPAGVSATASVTTRDAQTVDRSSRAFAGPVARDHLLRDLVCVAVPAGSSTVTIEPGLVISGPTTSVAQLTADSADLRLTEPSSEGCPPTASQSYAEGPGLETPQAGVEQQFTIHALDAAGSPVTSGGDVFSVSVTGPQSVTPSVQDNGDGTYLVRYTASVAGSYTVDVELDGESIRFTPRTVEVGDVYTFGGWTGALKAAPTVNAGKANKKLRLSWTLTDATGAHVGALTAVRSVSFRPTSCASFTTDSTGAAAATPSPGTSLAFDPVAMTYTYWWATPPVGCYTVFLTLADGQVIHAFFSFSK